MKQNALGPLGLYLHITLVYLSLSNELQLGSCKL